MIVMIATLLLKRPLLEQSSRLVFGLNIRWKKAQVSSAALDLRKTTQTPYEVGQQYVVHIKNHSVDESILRGEITKIKLLSTMIVED